MSKNIEHVQHLKSSVVINGSPKLPNPSALTEGEIAVNFAEGYETLSIKNESGNVVTFSSDNYYSEKKLGSGFTGENSGVTVTEAIKNSEEVSISSGETPSGTGIEIWIDESVDPAEADVYTKAQTDSLLNLKLDTSAYTEYWTSGTGENAVVLKNSSGTASGNFSVAEGHQTSATSICSHAEGGGTTASGPYSHAEGMSTSATSNHTHAEGMSTLASGPFSHAEGSGTAARGNYSHAEGGGTTAYGVSSHAEGNSTKASGESSHAEGLSTSATGVYSHSEGQSTKADGNSSHAEGSSTEASGYSSHAEGNSTTANGANSHAEGSYTTASGSNSHAEGHNTQANNMYAHAEGNATRANGNASHAEGENTTASGQSSHAEGGSTIASGLYSHAEGQSTEANNQSEHASGRYNVSSSASTEFGNSGNTLFSVGNGTADNARHNAFEIRQNGDIYIVNKNGQDVKLQDEIGNIEVDQTIDSGTSASTNAVSTSAVYGFVTSYTPSITVDQVLDDTTSASTNPVSSKAVYDAVTDNELVWTNAFVALSGTVSAHTANTEIHVTAADKNKWDNAGGGFSAITNPSDSTKVGLINKLSQHYDTNIGKGAVIEGDGVYNQYTEKTFNIVASGDYSHAEGSYTSAIGTYSHAEGRGTTASGQSSHAEGQQTVASESYSHAEGYSTTASGQSSHAEGYYTTANGIYSHAEGWSTQSNGSQSHAEGYLTKTIGNQSHAEGYSTTASGQSSHAEGNDTRANGDYSHAEGYGTTASGDYGSHAEGQNTVAVGWCAHAEGQNTVAVGYYSHAEGQGTIANGQYCAHAEGQNTIANNNSEHASGQYNISSSASTTFGDSGNTLFSVGNGVYDGPRHNAFEIRQNGDIYISSGGTITSPMIKLQDSLGVDLSNYYTKSETSGKTELTTAFAAKANTTDLADFFDDAKYEDSGTTKVINFYHGNTIKATIDATDFIVDGMVESVSAGTSGSTTVLDIKWNTAAGGQETILDIGDMFEADNYYTKSETSGATEISNALGTKVNSATYTGHTADTTIHFTTGAVQTQIDNSISGKVNTSDIVTAITSSNSGSTNPIATNVVAENELVVSTALNDLNQNKADKSTTYTKTEIDDMIGDIETLLAAI